MVIYTPEEVAEKLKIKPETIRRYLRSGKLKGAKFGKKWRISEEQVREFFDQNTKDTQASQVKCG